MDAFTGGFCDEIQKTARIFFRPSLKSLLAAGVIGGGAMSLKGRKSRNDARRIVPEVTRKAPQPRGSTLARLIDPAKKAPGPE